MIELRVLKECGYDEAVIGITLSHGAKVERAMEIAPRLAHQGSCHGKFLESIMLWLDVDAPRYWWAQADTYRVGTTKQSESTMHTITKRPLVHEDFSSPIPDQWLNMLNSYIECKDLETVKRLLPESFMQRRIWVMSYKTAQNIYAQRHDHKLQEWRTFCGVLLKCVQYPMFIAKPGLDV